jgi:hypothetical protein
VRQIDGTTVKIAIDPEKLSEEVPELLIDVILYDSCHDVPYA